MFVIDPVCVSYPRCHFGLLYHLTLLGVRSKLHVLLENGFSYNSCSAKLLGESVARIFENTNERVHFQLQLSSVHLYKNTKTLHRYFSRNLAPVLQIPFSKEHRLEAASVFIFTLTDLRQDIFTFSLEACFENVYL